jgi:hypothetical protein
MSVSGAAAAISVMAAAEAHAARVQACTASMRGFANDGATVAEIRQYADCANVMFPQPWSDGAILATKLAIVLLFAGFIVGAVHGWRKGYGGLGDAFFDGLGGLLVVIVGLLMVGLCAAGIRFLLT